MKAMILAALIGIGAAGAQAAYHTPAYNYLLSEQLDGPLTSGHGRLADALSALRWAYSTENASITKRKMNLRGKWQLYLHAIWHPD
jgi:hypothetical protein